MLLKNEKPLVLFSCLSAIFAISSLLLGVPVVDAFIETGLVERLPSALLAASLMIIAVGLLGLAISLDSLQRFRSEMRRLSYLSHLSIESTIELGENALRKS